MKDSGIKYVQKRMVTPVKMTITPRIAEEMLERNTKNRKPREARVQLWSNRMVSGQWRDYIPDMIAFDANGVLLNGQHRLLAVVRTGKAQKFFVLFGAPEDYRDVIDCGTIRTPGDNLRMYDEKDGNHIAAAVTRYFMWKRHGTYVEARIETRPSNTEMKEILYENPGLRDSVKKANKTSFLAAKGLIGFLHYVFWKIEPDFADLFLDSLATGEALSKNDPILKLRNRLIRNRGQKKTKLRAVVIAAFTVKAWNAFRDGKTFRELRWNDGEAFPIPR